MYHTTVLFGNGDDSRPASRTSHAAGVTQKCYTGVDVGISVGVHHVLLLQYGGNVGGKGLLLIVGCLDKHLCNARMAWQLGERTAMRRDS